MENEILCDEAAKRAFIIELLGGEEKIKEAIADVILNQMIEESKTASRNER